MRESFWSFQRHKLLESSGPRTKVPLRRVGFLVHIHVHVHIHVAHHLVFLERRRWKTVFVKKNYKKSEEEAFQFFCTNELNRWRGVKRKEVTAAPCGSRVGRWRGGVRQPLAQSEQGEGELEMRLLMGAGGMQTARRQRTYCANSHLVKQTQLVWARKAHCMGFYHAMENPAQRGS